MEKRMWKDRKEVLEGLYLIYFALVLAAAFKDTTMIPFGWTDTHLYFLNLFGGLVVFARIASDREWKMREMVLACLTAAVLLACWHHYMRRYVIELVILIVGARGVKFRKILKVYLGITAAALLFTALLAVGGVIENLVYIQPERNNLPRISFGSIYPTDFAAHVCFLAICYAWIRIRKLRYPEIAGILGAGVFCLVFCGARTTAVLLTCLSVFLAAYKRWGDALLNKQMRMFCCVSMPLLGIATILATALYDPKCRILRMADRLLNNRLSQGKEGMNRYPATILGQEVPMTGFGGRLRLEKGETYFFLDSSYINILLQYGIAVLLLVFFVFTFSAFRMKREGMYAELILLALVALGSVMEHHLIEIAYHPFWLLLLADLGGMERKDGREHGKRIDIGGDADVQPGGHDPAEHFQYTETDVPEHRDHCCGRRFCGSDGEGCPKNPGRPSAVFPV